MNEETPPNADTFTSLSPLLQHCELYRWELEWGVVPTLPQEKRPAVEWKQFQQRLPNQTQIDRWADQHWSSEKSGIGIVTGAASALAVMDIDSDGADQWLHREVDIPVTAMVETPRGKHLYFETSSPIRTATAACGVVGLDVRGQGGMVIAPPSPFADGTGEYRWVVDPRVVLAPMPLHLAQLLGSQARESVGKKELFAPILEGTRDNTLTSITGTLFSYGADETWVGHIVSAINEKQCRPPLPDDAVGRIVGSIAKAHTAGGTCHTAFSAAEAGLLARQHLNGTSYRTLAKQTGRSASTVQRAVTKHNQRSESYSVGTQHRQGSKRRPGKA